MRRILGTVLLALAIVGAGPVAASVAASSDTSDFTFDSFDATYELSQDDTGHSQLRVVETIVARFPDFEQNRGIIRAIPDNYRGVPLHTTVESIVDENGTDVPYETSSSDDFVELALGTDDFVFGKTTYVITYRQSDVVGDFSETSSEEFYWDVNGTGWDQPFGRVSAEVIIDPALSTAVTGDAACYIGASEEVGNCDIQQSGTTFSASATDLGPRENLTVSVGFTPGTFEIPEPTLTAPPNLDPVPVPLTMQLASGLPILGAIGAIVLAALMRVRSGRDAPGRGTIIPEYSEPKNITILQSSELIGRKESALPAAIVRLAVRGNIRILAYRVLEGTEAPYSLQYLGNDKTDTTDQRLLDVLFGSSPAAGTIKPFGAYDSALGTALTGIAAEQPASLLQDGFRTPPARTGLAWAIPLLMVFVLIGSVFAIGFQNETYRNVSPVLVISVVAAFIALIVTGILGTRRPLLTEKGALAREYLLGMKTYLDLAEKDRMEVLQSPRGAERVNVGDNLEMVKLYEKLLPWAVLWGVEDQWMRELAVRVESEQLQPSWYVGTNGFDSMMFSSTMSGISTSITPPPPPPSSSNGWGGSGGSSFSSGGSFGGGFSGGGGGGGGGGGR